MSTNDHAIAFPGQGAKPEAVLAALRTYRGHPLVERFGKTFAPRGADTLDLTDTAVAQPATYVLGVAETETALGASAMPSLVLGHSLGELTAAACAGVISLEDGYRLAVRRGAICRERNLRRPGAMIAVVASDAGEVEWLRRRTLAAGDDGVLEVAAVNSRRQVVLSGDVRTVDRAAGLAEQEYLRVERLPIGGSFHSPIMHAATPEWRDAVEAVEFRDGAARFVSAVDARVHADPAGIRDLLIRALLLPVRWRDAVLAARDAGAGRVWCAGPGDALLKLGRREGVLPFAPLADAGADG